MSLFRYLFLCASLTVLLSCSQSVVKQSEALSESSDSTAKSQSNDYFMNWRKFESPAVFITGVTGKNPIGYVKICFENVFQDKSAFIQQRYSPFIEDGNVVVTETFSSQGNTFLCQIAFNKYQPRFATHYHSRLIEVDGPGIYYLGTLYTRSPGEQGDYYLPQISAEVVENLKITIAKIREKYAGVDLPLKNFDLSSVEEGGHLAMDNLGKIIDIRAKQIAENKEQKQQIEETEI